MSKEKKYLNKRNWLNPVEHWDTGAIQSSVTFEYGYVDSNITIWDCSRKITLAFGFDSEKSAKQRAEKIDKLIEHLTEVRAAMGKAYIDLSEYEKTEEPLEES